MKPIDKDVLLYYISRTSNADGVWYCPDIETAKDILRSRSGVCDSRKRLIRDGWISEETQFFIRVIWDGQSVPEKKKIPVSNETEQDESQTSLESDSTSLNSDSTSLNRDSKTENPVSNETHPPCTPIRNISKGNLKESSGNQKTHTNACARAGLTPDEIFNDEMPVFDGSAWDIYRNRLIDFRREKLKRGNLLPNTLPKEAREVAAIKYMFDENVSPEIAEACFDAMIVEGQLWAVPRGSPVTWHNVSEYVLDWISKKSGGKKDEAAENRKSNGTDRHGKETGDTAANDAHLAPRRISGRVKRE